MAEQGADIYFLICRMVCRSRREPRLASPVKTDRTAVYRFPPLSVPLISP